MNKITGLIVEEINCIPQEYFIAGIIFFGVIAIISWLLSNYWHNKYMKLKNATRNIRNMAE